MVAFLFWNVADRPALDLIATACNANRVDLLVLAECNRDTGAILHALNEGRSESFFEEVLPVPRWVRLFSSLPTRTVRRAFDGPRFSIVRLRPPLGLELLVVAAHLQSKLYNSPDEQYFGARDLRNRITEWEGHAGHANAIIIGDLNMNPFDRGMLAADGLHAVMSKSIAGQMSRRFRNERWDFFYNPMWSRLGDESTGPPGTYFRRDTGLESLFWNTFDQVLLRPSLLPFYRAEQVRVISEIGEHVLANDQGIHAATGDHLPIFVELATEGAM
jgi:hypothetical protein